MGHPPPLHWLGPRSMCGNTKTTRGYATPPTPQWALLDLYAVGKELDTFTTLPCPARPTPNSLSRWFDISSARLTSHAPCKRPCPRSKPWWSPRMSSLRREYHRFARLSRLDPSPLNWSNVKCERRTYFKAIASAKKAHWSDFLSSATPRSVWTAKRFAFGRPPQRFPDLPGASNPAEVAETLLDHFFPSKPPPPPLLPLTRYEDYTPITSEEISMALSKSSNTSAPGPDHIPYSVWKSVHHIKPSLLPSLLDPLLAHGFHPPSLKRPLGIVLDKSGKPSYDSPSSFRVIVLLCTLSKILERVVASRLSAQATICSLIHPFQYGSLPGRCTADAALVLQHNVESFHRLRYRVSTLSLDVKGGFDNVECPSLLSPPQERGQPVPGPVGRLFPQGPHLSPDFPRVPSLLRRRLGRGPSRIPRLLSSIRYIRLLPPPGNPQVTYHLLCRRLCCHGSLALLQDQHSAPSEVLLNAQEKGFPDQHLLFCSEDLADPLEKHQEQ